MRAPFGDRHGEADVQQQRAESDGREPAVELGRQQADHKRDLDQRGQDVVDRVVQQRLDRTRTPLDVARDPAGLAFQVKPQAQGQQVLEGFQRHPAGNARGHRIEQKLAQLCEQRDRQAQRAVAHQQRDWDDQRGARIARLEVERVDQLLEDQRHADVGELGRHQATQGHQHAPAPLPDIRAEFFERRPVGVGRRRRRTRQDGGRQRCRAHQIKDRRK